MGMFLLSIIISSNGRGILAFMALIMLVSLVLSYPLYVIRKKRASKYNEKVKLEPKKLELRGTELEIEKQYLLNNCPNCGFKVKQIWKFCPQCHTVLKKEQDYTRLFLPVPINDYPMKVKRINYIIKIPHICPICGSRSVEKEYKIKPRFYYEKKYYGRSSTSLKDHSYLKFFFCKTHTQEKKKFNVLYIIFIIAFFSFIISLPLVLIWVTSSTTIFPVIILILLLTGIGWGLVYIVRKHSKMSSLIRGHIFHEYYPVLGAVLAVKNTSWMEEFRRYNKCLLIVGSIEEDLRNTEQLKKRYEIYFWISALLLITIALLSVFLSILIHERFRILGILGIFCFGFSITYMFNLLKNQRKERLEQYSNFFK